MKKCLFVIGIALLALLLVACSSPERTEAKVEKAKENVCEDLDALGAALEQYGEINAETSVADVRKATEGVEKAWSKLQKGIAKLEKAEAKATSASYDEFYRTVKSIPDSTSLGEASMQFSDAVVDLAAKQRALKTVVCP